ncbi:MAG: hypothetical protein DRJ98_05730 [Thermoprotei archaeon]|nr:MAG: hypothetical protein DRJ98_05730 [Thermoprotei archaeon]
MYKRGLTVSVTVALLTLSLIVPAVLAQGIEERKVTVELSGIAAPKGSLHETVDVELTVCLTAVGVNGRRGRLNLDEGTLQLRGEVLTATGGKGLAGRFRGRGAMVLYMVGDGWAARILLRPAGQGHIIGFATIRLEEQLYLAILEGNLTFQ